MSNAVKSGSGAAPVEMVTITIDDKAIKVPKGMNLIDAAREAGIDIPHYCYHPHLSIAGNCRMCQIEIVGQPKLAIGCNTFAAEGLNVRTHFSSNVVEEAQQATLEFLLINHPLDCTVCDQAGHCKLQDYYYEYDARGSRFIEEKVHKVKAEPLGPEIVYDGERCIMCTRCVRFCDEVTETSELAGYNRGDRGVIGIFPGKELDNPLSGSVVDLCPVGALTHRRWRFNTRIWYSDRVRSICPGCSTGCNVEVAARDDRIVQVKARLNSEVNQEWMCDEGRYGFERFQPPVRLTTPVRREHEALSPVAVKDALGLAAKLAGSSADDAAVIFSPFLTLEEVWTALRFAEQVMGVSWASGRIAVQLRQRSLTDVERKLVSPDFAPNGRAPEVFGLVAGEGWRADLERRYDQVLDIIRGGSAKRVLLIGDRSVLDADADARLINGIRSAAVSVAIAARSPGASASEREVSDTDRLGGAMLAVDAVSLVLPGRTVNEKSGVLVNRDVRLQRLRAQLTPPFGSLPEWEWLARIGAMASKPVVPGDVVDERALFREVVKNVPSLAGLTLQVIGDAGIPLADIGARVAGGGASSQSEARE